MFTRGGVHAHACTQALAKLTGMDTKMLPIPNIESADIPEIHPFMAEGMRRLYRFSPEERRHLAGRVAQRLRPIEVMDGPPTSGPHCQQQGVASASVPDYHPKKSSRLPRNSTPRRANLQPSPFRTGSG